MRTKSFILRWSLVLGAGFLSTVAYGSLEPRAKVVKVCSKLKLNYFRTPSFKKQFKIRRQLYCLNQLLKTAEMQPACQKVLKNKLKKDVRSAFVEEWAKTNAETEKVTIALAEGEARPFKVPSLLEYIDGHLYDGTHHSKGLMTGDMMVYRNPMFLPNALREHMMVTADLEFEEFGYLDYFHAAFDGTSKVFAQTDGFVVEKARLAVFRLNKSLVVSNMIKFLAGKAGHASYSAGKALKSFFTGGKKAPGYQDDLRMIAGLLRQSLADRGEVQAGGELDTLIDSHPEICSTYAGNALILGALKTKIDLASTIYPEKFTAFGQEVEALSVLLRAKSPLLRPEIVASAKRLIQDEDFREALELGTATSPRSPVFRKNMNRMTPAKLIRYLSELSSSECEFEELP